MSSKKESEAESSKTEHLIHDRWFQILAGIFLVLVGVSWLGIMIENSLAWGISFAEEDIDRALKLFKLPIGILAAGATALAFYATIYRSRQTSEQISLTIKQSEMSAKAMLESNFNNEFSRFTSAFSTGRFDGDSSDGRVEFNPDLFFLKNVSRLDCRVELVVIGIFLAHARAPFIIEKILSDIVSGEMNTDTHMTGLVLDHSFRILARMDVDLNHEFFIKSGAFENVSDMRELVRRLMKAYSFLFRALKVIEGEGHDMASLGINLSFMMDRLTKIVSHIENIYGVPSAGDKMSSRSSYLNIFYKDNEYTAQLKELMSESVMWAGDGDNDDILDRLISVPVLPDKDNRRKSADEDLS